MEEKTRSDEIARLTNEIQVINSRIADLKGEIAGCGFFQKGKKRELEQKLAKEKEALEYTVARFREVSQG